MANIPGVPTFATLTGGNQPLSLFDTAFTATGTYIIENSAFAGRITLIQNSSNTWTLWNNLCVQQTITSSTTNGLQEAINLACTPNGTAGYDLYVYGGNPAPFGAAVINCTTPVSVPALQGKHIFVSSCTIDFTSAVGASNGLTFDSLEMVGIEMPGTQIVYAGTGWAVAFIPTHGTPGDAIIVSGDVSVYITTVSLIAASGAFGGVLFNPVNGSMATANYKFDEIEGTGTSAIGIGIYTTTNSFSNNRLDIGHLHGMTGVPLLVGNSTSDTGTNANKFNINVISPSTTSNPCIDVYGAQNYFNVGISAGEGTPALGIKLETSATKNMFDVLRNDATTKCSDLSTAFDNVGMYGVGAACASVNLGGTNQTGVANNTATLVAFSSAVFNEGGAFNFTTHAWVPGRTGYARISATVLFTAGVVGTGLDIYIYKNGASVCGVSEFASINAGQSISVDFTVPVTAVTDYFQIYVIQATGSSQTISGAGGSTFANFEMINRR